MIGQFLIYFFYKIQSTRARDNYYGRGKLGTRLLIHNIIIENCLKQFTKSVVKLQISFNYLSPLWHYHPS